MLFSIKISEIYFDLTQVYIPISEQVLSSAGWFTQTSLKTKMAQNISRSCLISTQAPKAHLKKLLKSTGRNTQTGEE